MGTVHPGIAPIIVELMFPDRQPVLDAGHRFGYGGEAFPAMICDSANPNGHIADGEFPEPVHAKDISKPVLGLDFLEQSLPLVQRQAAIDFILHAKDRGPKVMVPNPAFEGDEPSASGVLHPVPERRDVD